jgi:hypothetical protein
MQRVLTARKPRPAPTLPPNSHIYTARFDGSDMEHYFELHAATWS